MVMRPSRTPFALCLALLGAAAPAPAARAGDSADKLKVVAKVVPAEGVPAGGTVRLEVSIEVEETWHIYGPGDMQATAVALSGGAEGLKVGDFRPDHPPRPHKGEFDDAPRQEYEGTVVYSAEIQVPAGTAAGERALAGGVTANACDPSICVAEGTAKFEARLRILPGGAVTPAPSPPSNGASPPPPVVPPVAVAPAAATPSAPEGITPAFLLAAVIAGLLTIATPCVFPMIPLTVSLLTKRAEKEPGRIVPNALVYGAGMFVSLAGIGLAMSLVFGVAPTDLALSPGFNLAIFAFLLVLALSLFGAYDLQLPAFLTDWAQGKAGAGGGAGLFFMGMTLAFTSFACAAPFAGALVVEARTSVVKGVVGMSVYAGTFSVPFVATALFPGLLKRLPRSGGWLNSVKVVMGFVEVAAAFKFLRAADMIWDWDVFSFEVVLAIWIACALGAFLYLLGLIVLPHDTKPESIGVGRLLWALLLLSSALYLLPGLFGRDLSAFVESFIIRKADEEYWVKNDLEKALHEAKEHGKPVFVDFTGFG
jgi:thiol:disulfide interchange protein DsbD